jgi:hypothetical protein
MTTSISLQDYLAPFARFQSGKHRLHQDLFIDFSPMNCIELTIHTASAQEKYLVEEKDNTFHISKYQRNFLGFWRYKKLAQAKTQEDALKIIHILTPNTILNTEVVPNQNLQGQWN